MNGHRSLLQATALMVLCATSLIGQQNDSQVVLAPGEAIARWREQRLGLFVHWGPVSLKGTEIGWSRGREVPVSDYDDLYRRFNPTEFDADAWVATAKAAGMKYLVFTSKHHDGFCLWDSRYTDYDIMATPLQRDILRELSDACRGQNLTFCTYHSICDWRHADYPLGSPGGKSAKTRPNMPRYVEYLHNQTAELIRNYGPIGIMWFDGEWEQPWTHAMGVELYQHIRALQPDILINNRVDKGRRGMEGTTLPGEFLGDYATPEQRVGEFNRKRPWESCITIGKQWAWKPNDKLKSLEQCVQTLLHVVGGDGNLLLNVGPMPDGRIEPRQAQRLREIGRWLDQYGDAVYGTRGGPFKPGPSGASTCKENKVYLFVFEWPADHRLRLPPIAAKVQSSRSLSRPNAMVTQTDKGLVISRADADLQESLVTIIELTVTGQAFDIDPVAVVDET